MDQIIEIMTVEFVTALELYELYEKQKKKQVGKE